jgi:hypothetical protein
MKATDQMIDAACEAAPNLQREDAANIVQAALDAGEVNETSKSTPRLIAGALCASGFLTFIFVLIGAMSSGSWLDPRVWSGEYVPGDTLASSMNNGSWMMDASASTAPWVFAGSFALFVAMILASKAIKR